MAKGTTSREIAQQNELLREQNGLLREQNNLLREQNNRPQQLTPSRTVSEREIFIENIDHDEVRNGFLVTSNRKKLWNVQIGLIKEFDRICKKYGLRWFVAGGTLLGAARHKGFIPWDDDVDIVMLRPEYQKFQEVAQREVRYPYFLDCWFNHRLESEKNCSVEPDPTLPLIPKESAKRAPGAPPFFPLIKLKDSRTLYLEFPDRPTVNQAIFIDIFPMDPLPPFYSKQSEINFEIARELLTATAVPEFMVKTMEENHPLLISYDEMKQFLRLPYKLRALKFEEFVSNTFFVSQQLGDLRDTTPIPKRPNVFGSYASRNFEDVTYLPFETIEIPAPKDYDDFLTSYYGDWHQMKIYYGHALGYSDEISSQEFFQKATLR